MPVTIYYMGKINLLVSNSNKNFNDNDLSIFSKASIAAEKFITNNFYFNYEVDVLITAPSYIMNTIPEDGISGRTYNSHFIIIVVNKEQSEVNEDIVFETICHEMSHSLRWEKLTETANTLFEVMILEGLAIALEKEALVSTGRKNKQFFLEEMEETDEVIANNIISQLRNLFDNQEYDYSRIFYDGDEKLPRWAGYRLGYYLVNKHLKLTEESIYKATLSSYKNFKY